MQSSAIERELLRGSSEDNNSTNWSHVQRIIHRQTSTQTLKGSLERIVEEFDLPLELLIFAVTKTCNAPGLASSLFRCIRNIWRRVLVDREAIAFRFFAEYQQQPGPIHAQREFTKQLLAIHCRTDLIHNQVFLHAFKKTKYLIQTIQEYDPQTLPPTVSLLHALILAGMPPFLIFLAAKDEPASLMKRDTSTGKLPLHMAMDAKLSCQRLVDPYRIRFILTKDDYADRADNHHNLLLSLLNRPSPVNLLCHLYPQAGSKADQSSLDSDNRDHNQLDSIDLGHVPLETFLYTMDVLPACVKQWNLSWYPITKVFLNDLQTVIRLAPQILDTRSFRNHLFPFLVPMLHWNSFQPNTNLPHSIRDGSGQNFLLTLSYTLLKENPMVLQHCYKSDEVVIEPWTAYGKVLKKRITRIDQYIDDAIIQQEELKRKIAEIEKENQNLWREKDEANSGGFSKRVKPCIVGIETTAPS